MELIEKLATIIEQFPDRAPEIIAEVLTDRLNKTVEWMQMPVKVAHAQGFQDGLKFAEEFPDFVGEKYAELQREADSWINLMGISL